MVNFGHVTVTNIVGYTSDTPEVSDGCTSERKGDSKLWKTSYLNILKVWGGVVGWLKLCNYCHFLLYNTHS